MAIPGLKPSYDVRAKVRIGEKKTSQGGKEYPAALDYFVCDDTEFMELTGTKPKVLRIEFPFADAADNFSTGLEMWRGKQLSCYSKGEMRDGEPVAYRVNSLLSGFTVIGEPMGRGKERTPVVCKFRSCPNFIRQGTKPADCKPMGRLQFFLAGQFSHDTVYQLDTKSWNTIEGIEATLAAARADLRERVFLLSVAIEQKANQKFPVISLKEEAVNITTPSDVVKADAFLVLNGALAGDDAQVRTALASALDVTNPGWRDKEPIIARIKEIGVREAAKNMLARNDA